MCSAILNCRWEGIGNEVALTHLWVLFLYAERLLNVKIGFIVTFLQVPDCELPETKINCVKEDCIRSFSGVLPQSNLSYWKLTEVGPVEP
jgi:hypothetical protein